MCFEIRVAVFLILVSQSYEYEVFKTSKFVNLFLMLDYYLPKTDCTLHTTRSLYY